MILWVDMSGAVVYLRLLHFQAKKENGMSSLTEGKFTTFANTKMWWEWRTARRSYRSKWTFDSLAPHAICSRDKTLPNGHINWSGIHPESQWWTFILFCFSIWKRGLPSPSPMHFVWMTHPRFVSSVCLAFQLSQQQFPTSPDGREREILSQESHPHSLK